jgi:hypothetical protein
MQLHLKTDQQLKDMAHEAIVNCWLINLAIIRVEQRRRQRVSEKEGT